MHDLYERHDGGETAVVTLRGELDAHDAPRLRELFAAAVNRCVEGGRLCMADMMAIDAAGGGGKVGIANLARQPWRGAERLVVAGLCTPADPEGRAAALNASYPNNRQPKDL